MNKVAFIFSGYSRNLIFSNDSVVNCDAYKEDVLNILKHLGSNMECINLMLENLARVKNIDQCTFILNRALSNFLIMEGIKPNYLMGFSVGNIHALECAGSISLECAMKCLEYRNNIVKKDKTLKTASMLLVEEIDYSLTEVLISKYKDAYPICYNTNKSITVLIQEKFKEKIFHDIKYAGGKATPLNKNVIYSLPFLNLKNTELFMYLNGYEYGQPKIDTYINSSLFSVNENAALSICNSFEEPVILFNEIKNLVNLGVNLFIEIGGKGLLINDIKNIVSSANIYSVNDLKSLQYVKQKLLMHV